ncbi:class I SAM-dependent methyltransferase [Patescibacteria group bacterium]
MSKLEIGDNLPFKTYSRRLDYSLNEVKHVLDFGPIANRRKRRAQYHIEQTGILDNIIPSGRYLDVGCGKGYVGGEIKSEVPDVEIFGVDLDDRPTNRMRKIVSGTFSTADACKLPFPGNSFDGTMVFFVMHHMPTETQEFLLKEAVRVTKKGGLIFIAEDTVSQDDSSQLEITTRADRRLNPDFCLEKPHNFRSKDGWGVIFEDLGLTNERIVDYQSGKVPHTFFVLSN